MSRTAEPNYIKHDMYTDTISKLDRAIELGFYYEAIMLEYALIEDRLTEMLDFLGIVNRKEKSLSVTAKMRKPLRTLLGLNSTARIGIQNINTKLNVLSLLANRTEDTEELIAYSAVYLQKKVEREKFTSTLECVRKWKDDRNTYVHGLMDKVPYDLEPQLDDLVRSGKKLFRELDSYAKKLKKCDVRKKYKIQ